MKTKDDRTIPFSFFQPLLPVMGKSGNYELIPSGKPVSDLTPKEVSRMLRISYSTVMRWIQEGPFSLDEIIIYQRPSRFRDEKIRPRYRIRSCAIERLRN